MSGGSFNYLYYEIEEKPIDRSVLDRLKDMSNWLAEPEQGKHEASCEIARVHSELVALRDKIERVAQGRDFLALLKEVEWWCSNDTGEESFDAVWSRYKHSR